MGQLQGVPGASQDDFDTLSDQISNPEVLTIVKGSVNYTISRGFAYRFGKLVVFSIEMSSSAQVSSSDAFVRFDDSNGNNVKPIISNDNTTYQWEWPALYGANAGMCFMNATSNKFYIKSGSTFAASTTIIFAGSFMCQ